MNGVGVLIFFSEVKTSYILQFWYRLKSAPFIGKEEFDSLKETNVLYKYNISLFHYKRNNILGNNYIRECSSIIIKRIYFLN